MNIPKAIKILEEHVAWCDPVKEVETYDALKLGIEALERVQEDRVNYPSVSDYYLPGETE